MKKFRIGIIGSGIQGVCIGLQLIKKGIPATIFDKNDDGFSLQTVPFKNKCSYRPPVAYGPNLGP